jgi:transposase-like protein
MASKGQKFNKYTVELKNEILNKYFEGKGTSRTLGKEYGISYRTIDTWLHKVRHPELALGLKKGRPKNEESDYKERYEILKKYQAFIEARHKTK